MQVNRCPHCGYDLEPNAKLCPCCGYRFQPPRDGNDYLDQNVQSQPYGNIQNQHCNNMQNTIDDTQLLNKFYKESKVGGAVRHWNVFLLLSFVLYIIVIIPSIIELVSWVDKMMLNGINVFNPILFNSIYFSLFIACSVPQFTGKAGIDYDLFTIVISRWLKCKNYNCKPEFCKYYSVVITKTDSDISDKENKMRFIRAVYLQNVGIRKTICYNINKIIIHIALWISLYFFLFGSINIITSEILTNKPFDIRGALLKCCSDEIIPLVFIIILWLGRFIYEAVATHIFDKHFKEWAGKYMAQ